MEILEQLLEDGLSFAENQLEDLSNNPLKMMTIKDISTEPTIDVGVMSAEEIHFSLTKDCRLNNRTMPAGDYLARLEKGEPLVMACAVVSIGEDEYSGKDIDTANLPIEGSCRKPAALKTESQRFCQGGKRCCIVPFEENRGKESFSLQGVRIGIDFHWDRLQTQHFMGELHFQVDDSQTPPVVVAINRLLLEDYLLSVISSEMSAKAGVELLRAHAIISRSWLLAQGLGKHLTADKAHSNESYGLSSAEKTTSTCGHDTEYEHIRWYERDTHRLFDVCADDHCQRYQGISLATTPQVKEALATTRGMVLACEDEICDARFYKCCGGKTEHFEACWADTPKPYLQSVCDNGTQDGNPDKMEVQDFGDLRDEAAARAFICAAPDAFCHTDNKEVLQQVLNDYDRETPDFYRWQVRYSIDELSDIVKQRSGMDFGRIRALIPVERSHSARLTQLKIVGEKRSLIVGKELEIRKFLSKTHLYSSAFVADNTYDAEGKHDGFLLQGAGWGHGVGLCQIGAAVMSRQGRSYQEILRHYYPHTEIVSLY